MKAFLSFMCGLVCVVVLGAVGLLLYSNITAKPIKDIFVTAKQEQVVDKKDEQKPTEEQPGEQEPQEPVEENVLTFDFTSVNSISLTDENIAALESFKERALVVKVDNTEVSLPWIDLDGCGGDMGWSNYTGLSISFDNKKITCESSCVVTINLAQ